MTRYILLTAVSAFTYVNCCQAQQDYQQTLRNTFLAYDTTQNMETKVAQSNKLGMIAKKWNNEWTAHYYNAYAKAQLSYMEKDEAKRDAYVDEAEKELDETIGLVKENDETHVLGAMIANARMAVKPQARWQKYGKVFSDNLEKAKEINPKNPRIYYLQGTSKFFTPKMFGGGKKAALPYFEKAAEYYAQESDADMAKPFWGKIPTQYFLKESKGEDKD
ncbi:MAG: hypothetical protein EOP56_10525 [Sphingobacteriales bacterium]|nr:MAG: hypothetical protein EOP56_10525 [Sphingobacteriales bacterium]